MHASRAQEIIIIYVYHHIRFTTVSTLTARERVSELGKSTTNEGEPLNYRNPTATAARALSKTAL